MGKNGTPPGISTFRAVSPSPELMDPSRINSYAFPKGGDATQNSGRDWYDAALGNEYALVQRQVELGSISPCQFGVADHWSHNDSCGTTAAILSNLLLGSTPMALVFICMRCE